MEKHSEEKIDNPQTEGSQVEPSVESPTAAHSSSPALTLGSGILEATILILLQSALMIICTKSLGIHMIPSASISATGILFYYLIRQPLMKALFQQGETTEKLDLKEKLTLTVQGIILCLMVAFFYDFFLKLIDYQPKAQNVEKLFSGDFSLTAAYLMLVYSAPVWEEIVFRGILQESFQKVLSPAVSIIICGLIFGLVHADMDQLVPLVMLGWVFGWMYYRSKSVFPSILAHSLVNTLGAFTLLSNGKI